jgi:putative ABC transport system permease protein
VIALITTAVIAVLLIAKAQHRRGIAFEDASLPDSRDALTLQAMNLVAAIACFLALLNMIASSSAAVLDARHPLAVARALGATPGQAGLGLAVAQLLPAVPGVGGGVFFGIALFWWFGDPDEPYPSPSAMMLASLGILTAIVLLTVIPGMIAARKSVADTLESAPV